MSGCVRSIAASIAATSWRSCSGVKVAGCCECATPQASNASPAARAPRPVDCLFVIDTSHQNRRYPLEIVSESCRCHYARPSVSDWLSRICHLLAVMAGVELHETHVIRDRHHAEDGGPHRFAVRGQLPARRVECVMRRLQAGPAFGRGPRPASRTPPSSARRVPRSDWATTSRARAAPSTRGRTPRLPRSAVQSPLWLAARAVLISAMELSPSAQTSFAPGGGVGSATCV